jgi:predicted nucleic acid-binding Zn ribbon protein
MGGLFGGGGNITYKMPADNSAAIMQQMMQQQIAAAREAAAAAERAQREAAIAAENRSAEQKMQQSTQSAADTLSRMQESQYLADQAALNRYKQEQEAAGTAATGGGFDINASRNAALANLGAASTTLPSTAANLAANPALINPALTTAESLNTGTGGTTQRTNVFTLPNAEKLTFGGA